MKIIEMKLEELKPYENNPRRNESAVSKVAASIEEFGFKVPIIVDKNNVIVAGHTRLKAAEMLGLDSVPVIRADDLTEEQAKAFRLADNKTAEMAGWDFSKLEQELENIKTINMEDFGFDLQEFNIWGEMPTDEIISLILVEVSIKTGYEVVILPITRIAVKALTAHEEKQNK